VSGGLALLGAFCHWKIEHQIRKCCVKGLILRNIAGRERDAGSPHRRSQGEPKGIMPPKFLENIVILCFERRFSKQNSGIRLKSNILAPQKFWAVYATGSLYESGYK